MPNEIIELTGHIIDSWTLPRAWDLIISELQQLGAVLLHGSDVQTAIVEQHGVLPARFYSTTNLPTQVRLNGQWINVENIEMDVAIVIDRAKNRAYGKPMHEARVGEQVVIGYEGIRVLPFERARDRESFAFMQSTVSSEKAKVLAIHAIARQMRETRAHGGKILFVLGPAVIHTGAGRYIADLIRRGYVQVIFGGNAIITHDIE